MEIKKLKFLEKISLTNGILLKFDINKLLKC